MVARGFSACAAFALALGSAAAAGAAGLTLEQLLSSPFPSQLVAARQGSRVAWVFDHQGERNVWVAGGPAFVPRQVTRPGAQAAGVGDRGRGGSGRQGAVLLVHGDDDRNVPFQQTGDLVQRLRAQHVDFEELVFPDEIHDFLMWRTLVQAYRATVDFFDRRLKPGGA